MSKCVRIVGLGVICAALMFCSGCMGLSMFTSSHTHYHGGAEMQERVEELEARLDAAEQGGATKMGE
jgi:hypothetical protein